MKKKILINFFCLYYSLIFGQCMQVPVSLQDRIEDSLIVVEGTVTAQQGYWDSASKNIYTVYDIQVLKVFNGIVLPTTIKIVTRGGIVGLDRETVSDAIILSIGDTGTLFLELFEVPMPLTDILYKSVAAADGWIGYNLITNTATSVFDTYDTIVEDLYPAIMAITGIPISGLKSNAKKKAKRIMGIQGFEPQKVNAGTADLLTIQGFGFGNTAGTVRFADANNGGRGTISSLPKQIISWSETSIVVEVPSSAGTGPIAVVTNGEQQSSVQSLEVVYNHLNVAFDDGSGNDKYETQLVNDNLLGGYTFQYFSDFATNTEATTVFDRLINSWSCGTGFNTTIGATTSVDEDAADGINIVRFDNGDEVSGNTLAYARSRYRGCIQNGRVSWYVQEIEVVINDDYNWYYKEGTPENNQVDFETVLLHEIGHTQQLGHVIDVSEVMHFSVNFGQQKRNLSSSDIDGGAYVMDKSTAEVVCAQAPMTKKSGEQCSTLLINTNFKKIQASVYPNPTQGKVIITTAFEKQIKKIVVFDIKGAVPMTNDVSHKNKVQQVDLTSLDPGLYIILLATKTTSETLTVLKK